MCKGELIMEIIKDYIIIPIILVCLFVGYILKNLVKTDKINKFIPLIMAVLGILLSLWINEWSFTMDVLLAGFASGLASSGAYDGYKAIKEYFGNVITNLIEFMKNDTDRWNE